MIERCGCTMSRGSPRGPPYLGEEEAKSCCGLLVTQAVSIRWFIIMIAFVGLCCTVVGTVLGAVKTYNSEYVTITLLMIGVGIVLITVSGVAWHLTSRDAPCRVMLGLAPHDPNRGEPRRFMARMAPAFGRPHHPYAAMMYPEFQYRPPPPSYQASMQEYRLRLLLLDRHHNHPPATPQAPSPPPTYRSGAHNLRGLTVNTLGRESNYSQPPSYRSREGSVSHNPDATGLPSSHPGGPLAPAHSRDPSCLSFLSHDSVYSGGAPPSQDGSVRVGVEQDKVERDKVAVVGDTALPLNASTSKKDDNTVTIVQTTDSSQVIGSDTVVVTVSGSQHPVYAPPAPALHSRHAPPAPTSTDTEISVLAHL
ncbi:hypothetical protein Pcinc_019884 [Petrolisthes cinctipes]|uniref:Uncharacterized protein n=1 Tax=Petrolisthes cinctipes TaxID=88211 RepID=A0AAE1FNU8_PETCI|nr:hypothetical protein Pcinc_019884 [Petrolisthes cinctipes]